MNLELGSYPDTSDPMFYDIISSKKEFSDNNISSKDPMYCLAPQQRFLSNFINPNTPYDGVLIYHSPGVGKTLTAISIAENFKKKYKIIVLVKNKNIELNFRKEFFGVCSEYNLSKDKISIEEVEQEINRYYIFMTYSEFISNIVSRNKFKLRNIEKSIIIIDEAHNVIGNDTYLNLKNIFDKVVNKKIVLLSATPIYDNISEIFEMSNLLGSNLPIRKDLFKNGFATRSDKSDDILSDDISFVTKKGMKELEISLRGKISYLEPDNEFFPKIINKGTPVSPGSSVKITLCPMSKFQYNIYLDTLKPTSNKDTNFLFKNSSNSLTMVYPDSSYDHKGYIRNVVKSRDISFLLEKNIYKYSSKLYNLLKNISMSPGSIFIYSNLVSNAGINLLKYTLIKNGYKNYSGYPGENQFIMLDDSLTPKRKQALIRTFNKKENSTGSIIKIIIGSPVVSEGLTFKNIRQIHVLEPYWNMSKIEQVIGRGVRFMSHSMLDKSKRNTEIFLYAAVAQDNNDTIDYLKYKLSDKKLDASNEVKKLLRGIAVDCYLNKERNNPEYCIAKRIGKDNSTYNLLKHDRVKYNYIFNKIKELYSENGYVYDINYIKNFIGGSNIEAENINYVLNDIVFNRIKILNLNKVECYLIKVDNYYLVNPKFNNVSEQYFDKMFSKKTSIKSIYQIKRNANIEKRSKRVIDPAIKSGIYGTYSSRAKVSDNKFRIIDLRNKSSSNSKELSSVSGMLCSSYSTDELKEITKYLNISLLDDKKYSKKNLCYIIEKQLNKLNNIIK